MDVREAYKILEIPEGSSKEEAKKAFKKMAGKWHPDINKEPGAETKFKEVNEAFQVIESGRPSGPQQSYNGPEGFDFINFQDLGDFININFGGLGNQNNPKRRSVKEIIINQTISFKESVLGCIKDIEFERDDCCTVCAGAGNQYIDNCSKCHGQGFIINRQGFTIMQQNCPDCKGKANLKACTNCSSKGFIPKIKKKITVNIPARVKDGNILNLGNIGHYAGHFNGPVLLKMSVIKQGNLSLIDNDVISNIKITLLEALEGASKIISTIDGQKEIKIPKGSKNKDEVILPKLGVERKGNHRTVIDIVYPENISDLINFLKDK